MDVHDIWAISSDDVSDPRRRSARPDRIPGEIETPTDAWMVRDLIAVIDRERNDTMAVTQEELDLLLEDRVLAAPLTISVVHHQDDRFLAVLVVAGHDAWRTRGGTRRQHIHADPV
jgi:hypothetical protein